MMHTGLILNAKKECDLWRLEYMSDGGDVYFADVSEAEYNLRKHASNMVMTMPTAEAIEKLIELTRAVCDEERNDEEDW